MNWKHYLINYFFLILTYLFINHIKDHPLKEHMCNFKIGTHVKSQFIAIYDDSKKKPSFYHKSSKNLFEWIIGNEIWKLTLAHSFLIISNCWNCLGSRFSINYLQERILFSLNRAAPLLSYFLKQGIAKVYNF